MLLRARLGTGSEDAASYVTGTHIPVDGGLNMTVAKDWQRFLPASGLERRRRPWRRPSLGRALPEEPLPIGERLNLWCRWSWKIRRSHPCSGTGGS